MPTREVLECTLDELEGVTWGKPEYQSQLVTECHRLRTVPIGQFTVENLRIMIGQQFGLSFLVPLALDKLEENPFAQGDFYRGDLLLMVLRVKSEFWQRNSDLLSRLCAVMAEVQRLIEFVNEEALPEWNSHFGQTMGQG